MKTKFLLTMTAAALVLASCGTDENGTDDVQNSEIRLSSGVTAQTRAFGIDQQISSGRTVAVYVDKTTDGSTLYANNELKADGEGGFTGGEVMYFPDDKESVSIYALATNVILAGDFPTAAVTHAVSANQTVVADYAASDLLYAAKKEVALTESAVDLTFYHMLSKVEVALKVGASAPNLEGAEVSIVGTKLKADFTPSKAADVTTQPARAAMIAATAAGNDATDIKISNQVTTEANWEAGTFVYNEAVIVPQAVAQNAKFIKVTLANNGGELFHKLEAATTFESGKKYSYQITVNLTELTVTSTIADWEAVGEPVEGDIEMEMPAKVGDFYMKDGTWLPGATELTTEQKANCVGIVFKMGRDAEGNWADDCDYTLKDGTTEMKTIQGYVLALYDANGGNGCKWSPYAAEVGTKTAGATGFDGYKNTNTIKEYATNNSKTLETDFPATYYATNGYEATHPSPDNTSGWFLPSVGQCQYWFNNKTILLASVQKATGTAESNWADYYWSSSEYYDYPAFYAWLLSFYSGSVYDDGKGKSKSVRSLLAF